MLMGRAFLDEAEMAAENMKRGRREEKAPTSLSKEVTPDAEGHMQRTAGEGLVCYHDGDWYYGRNIPNLRLHLNRNCRTRTTSRLGGAFAPRRPVSASAARCQYQVLVHIRGDNGRLRLHLPAPFDGFSGVEQACLVPAKSEQGMMWDYPPRCTIQSPRRMQRIIDRCVGSAIKLCRALEIGTFPQTVSQNVEPQGPLALGMQRENDRREKFRRQEKSAS
ncbi:hypothetical protein QBC45DRAFT_102359 [Copromyces sp. CBS 386.78]|nr:hypothetical protein QBC45DRAFT_102359 [Copromyces sp. CBS 386.78]